MIGAATGRAISGGEFQSDGISGFQLPTGRFHVVHTLIEDAAQFGLPDAQRVVRLLRENLTNSAGSLPHLFAILLVDADARCEERLTAALGTELGGIPLVGGSAGDVYFNPGGHAPGSTRILYGQSAHAGAAVLALVACKSAVAAFSHNHFTPGSRRLVITDADPDRRLVREINGRRALEAYAAACGLRKIPERADDPTLQPLMIRIGGRYFARGMQRMCEDSALEFACAMEPGMVVTVARPGNLVARLEEMFVEMRHQIGAPELVIGFDCAARTVFVERSGLTAQVGALFRRNGVVGFSTLGEQFNTIHMNNSFTCLGIGRAQADS